jgi:hypothetical protein
MHYKNQTDLLEKIKRQFCASYRMYKFFPCGKRILHPGHNNSLKNDIEMFQCKSLFAQQFNKIKPLITLTENIVNVSLQCNR